jgi:transposase
MKKVEEILEKILLPIDSSWKILDLKVNELTGEIEVELEYVKSHIELSGKSYGIYDHRPIRRWRHLDLWQYKTYISARLPRYKDEEGFYHTVEVSWAEPSEQMTALLEKKL